MSKRPRKPKHKFMDQFLPRQTRDAPGTPRNNSEMVSWSWGGSWMYWDGSPHLGTKRHRHFGIVKSWTVYYKLISVWLQPLIIHHHFHFANEKAKAHKKLNKFLAPGPTASIWKNKHLKSVLADITTLWFSNYTLGTYLKEQKSGFQKYICTSMFTAKFLQYTRHGNNLNVHCQMSW